MNHIIEEFQARSYSHCFVTCLQYKEKCKSFNFQFSSTTTHTILIYERLILGGEA